MEVAESEEASSEPTAISDADDTPRGTGMVRVLHHGFFVLLTPAFQAVGLAGDHIITQVGSPVAVVDPLTLPLEPQSNTLSHPALMKTHICSPLPLLTSQGCLLRSRRMALPPV